jgi:MFS family permease
MDLYKNTFGGLLLLNSIVLYRSWRAKSTSAPNSPTTSEKVEHRGREDGDGTHVQRLKWKFLPVYLLVNGADWLQGPYIYPIYKGMCFQGYAHCVLSVTNLFTDEKGLAESLVALLFMVGFLSGGVSASFAGSFADRFGRKAACLAYCVLYSLSCLTLLGDNIVILFLGRILGGMSGTLLYSVFESWLVAEFNGLMLDDQSGSILSGIFSTMTMLNSVVAIVAGVMAEWLVRATGTAKAPFMASMACLSLAFLTISKSWSENYGTRDEEPAESASLLAEEGQKEAAPSKSVVKLILSGK